MRERRLRQLLAFLAEVNRTCEKAMHYGIGNGIGMERQHIIGQAHIIKDAAVLFVTAALCTRGRRGVKRWFEVLLDFDLDFVLDVDHADYSTTLGESVASDKPSHVGYESMFFRSHL